MNEFEESILVNERVNGILTDRAKINGIVDLIEELDGNNTVSVMECIDGLGKVFSSFVKSGECSPLAKGRSPKKEKKKNAEEPEEIYHTWLTRKYRVAIEKLLKLLHCSDLEVQERSLSTLMGFLTAESQKLHENYDRYIFPNEFFLKIVTNITNGSNNMENVIKSFKQHLHYADISYYVLRNLSRIVSRTLEAGPPTKERSRYFSRNVFNLLRQVSIPQSEDDISCLLSTQYDSSGHQLGSREPTDHSVTNLTSHKKVFTGAWTSFLNLSLDTDIHRQVLAILHEKVMPHLLDPKILIDFLTDSYNVGGVTSILSLNSLFILVHHYNLDYPDFYKKLYSLFNAEVFHLKYRERFFQLADLFLTSTHLPAYLVAAFIKRLSRLALRAPPFGVALSITFVANLIRRHPNCKVLIHRKKARNLIREGSLRNDGILTDPFIEGEADPGKCQAVESSLWELETLRRHYYPGIKSLIELFEKPMSKHDIDLTEYCSSSFESLFQKECVELTKSNAFVEFRIPKVLFSDSMNELWSVK